MSLQMNRRGTMGGLRRENGGDGCDGRCSKNPPGMRLSRNLNILQCKTAVRAAFEGKRLFRSLSTRRELRCASAYRFHACPFIGSDTKGAALIIRPTSGS
jgi:hypothetical protein